MESRAMTDPPCVILVVDDEPDILASVKLVLQRPPHAYHVLTAPSGARALDLLRTHDVDLVISDYKMPGMDGIAFLVEVRRVRPHLPRAMFTAYADEALARRAVEEAGVLAFMPKTLSSRDLVSEVSALLDAARSPGGASGAGPG